MLLSELYKIMVNIVTFLSFRGLIVPIATLDPPPVLCKLIFASSSGITIQDLARGVNLAETGPLATVGDVLAMGVRQGCLISPTLFNVYAEAMMKEALDDLKEGICVGGELVQSVSYADDQAMAAYTEKGLQNILDETEQ